MGKKDIEDALSRLDMLTNEENSMVMMRILEVTHHIDAAICDVDHNVKATKMHIDDVDCNIKETKVFVEDIEVNMKEIEGVTRGVDNCTQRFLSVFTHIPTFCPIVSQHSQPRA